MFERNSRPLESYSKIWLGTIALVTLVVVLAGVTLFGELDLGKAHYRAQFVQAAQLQKGGEVTIAGVRVGKVDGVTLAGDHVVVDFTIDDDVRLGSESRAAIKLTTLLGSRYLELAPAGDGGLENSVIPLTHTEVPYDLQKTLAGATSTFGALDAERVVDSVRTLNANMQGLPEALPEALDNLYALAGIMADRRDQLGTLLSNSQSLTVMLRNQQAELGALVLQGRDLLGEIATRRESVQRLFAAVTLLVDRVKAIIGDEPAINQLLADAREFTAMMKEHDALLRNILQVSPVAIRNITNATGSSNSIAFFAPGGVFIDSWMCALSGRAEQLNLVEYFKDCE